MSSHRESLEIAFLTVLLFGVLGNLLLLYLHSLKFIAGHRKRLISLIIINLALAHTLMIIFRGIPIVIVTWGWRAFLDDMMEKILLYLIRVTRGVSLSTTCLLSVFQAITISPNSLMWAGIKTGTYKYIVPCTLFCGIFNIPIDVIVAANISDTRNSSNERWRIAHSSFNFHAINIIKIVISNSVVDALFVGLMICSSGYMVFVLHRHSQQVQHIHSVSLSPRHSPEIRATKAILMLVITFVCFNSASSPFVIYIASTKATRYWGMRFTVVSLCFIQ
ncbi:LOW QUALITY PROTEIN: vomeronasal type-1 receptor 3-like [Vombatus ursinus]|uniref:LOW QUALITY PROTEIN: vomeronasal type-1 receptor 3-like n=1 Tax=Vombatus ursinus TaxID=29139 RepID=UPI000FFDBE5B|nr:LOW QUALITY PROTEIN: vomeronasal type-1 receptor 3-like [Vombatus ursinus]